MSITRLCYNKCIVLVTVLLTVHWCANARMLTNHLYSCQWRTSSIWEKPFFLDNSSKIGHKNKKEKFQSFQHNPGCCPLALVHSSVGLYAGLLAKLEVPKVTCDRRPYPSPSCKLHVDRLSESSWNISLTPHDPCGHHLFCSACQNLYWQGTKMSAWCVAILHNAHYNCTVPFQLNQ